MVETLSKQRFIDYKGVTIDSKQEGFPNGFTPRQVELIELALAGTESSLLHRINNEREASEQISPETINKIVRARR